MKARSRSLFLENAGTETGAGTETTVSVPRVATLGLV